jgi:hypothetical protein
MKKNPYKFIGPLNHFEDEEICNFRSEEIFKVVNGIRKGEYFSIIATRNIGKTTFLRQIQHLLSTFPCIYINLEISPKSEESFYDWIINIMLEAFDEKPRIIPSRGIENRDFEVNFFKFLKTFRPGKDKKIILLFDDIENTPPIKPFLKIWRKVFLERYDQPELKKYAVLISGGIDIIELTMGNTSPFNIANRIFLKNLNEDESEILINWADNDAEKKFEPELKKELIELTSGHPQMLQHICHILVEGYFEKKRKISLGDVDEAIKRLFSENDNLITLGQEMKNDENLRKLIKDIHNGKKIEYFCYENLFLSTNGLIVQCGKYCAFNNKIYERFIKYFLKKKNFQKKLNINQNSGIINIVSPEKNRLEIIVIPISIISGIATIFSLIASNPWSLGIFGFITSVSIILFIFKQKK